MQNMTEEEADAFFAGGFIAEMFEVLEEME